MSLEAELIRWLQQTLPQGDCLEIGLGDDAAVLSGEAQARVVTTDLLTDGIDFLLAETDPRAIGHKALGVNLSDLAAMAAEPVAAFVSLVLPRRGTSEFSALELAQELYRGMLPLCEEFGVTIAGGDTNTWDGPLAISLTALGRVTARGPLTRSGAQAGDVLVVTGWLGGSICGRHLAVEPRVSEALLLHDRYPLHAAMDISDGLALDASRLAKASGCGILVDLAPIPISPAAHRLSQTTGKTPLEHALGDGEDFELLLAVPPEAAAEMLADQPLAIPLTGIGTFIDQPGLWKEETDGTRSPLSPTGYQHEADQ